jgi:predicted GNAT family N-acyltransferase
MIKEAFTFGLPKDAEEIRQEVFTLEQGFAPEIDLDEHDKEAWHVVLYLDGYPISTGRVFPEDPETYHIGRVAVRKKFRGMKVGSYTMKFLCTKVEVKEGRLTGRFLTKNCFGKQKVVRLQELYPDRKEMVLTAYGDSRGDKEMLDYANEGYYKPFR